MKKYTILILLLFTASFIQAQSAKTYYNNAQSAYKQEKFSQCVNYLKKCKNTLGKTNPKIEGLLAQAYFQKGSAYAKDAKIAIDRLYAITPSYAQSSSNFQKYKELRTKINSAIWESERSFQRSRMYKADNVIEKFEKEKK